MNAQFQVVGKAKVSHRVGDGCDVQREFAFELLYIADVVDAFVESDRKSVV